MKKLLSAILALALLLSVWSFPVVAEDGQAEDPAVVQGAAEEEAGEEEGEQPEGTVLAVAEDPEPEAEEPEAEEPVKEEPVAEEPEAEEPEAEEPVAEEPEAEEPEAEEPVKEEPEAEEPEAEEPEAEEPVKEEPVAEEPEAEEPEAEEPVKEEPVAEEPEAEEPVKEEPVAEEPVAEESVKEEPVAEEPVAEEPVPEAPVHFEQGYVSIKKGAKAYAEASKKEEYGLFTADATVYAESEKQQDDPAKDWLKITFAADGALETAYVQAGTVKALEDGEAEALEAKLEKDTQAKEYKGHKLPAVSFVKPETPVAEETVKKEAVGQQAPAEEGKAEEAVEVETVPKATEQEAAPAPEEAAPEAVEKETAPKQQEAAPKQEAATEKETVKVSAAVTPRVASGMLDETVSFGVVCKNAEGKVSYQWQASSDGGKTWEDLKGKNAAALELPVTEKNAQRKYRCLVATDEGTGVSSECRINGTLSVTAKPKTKAANFGDTVSFKAEVSFASGTVKYQWQQSKDEGKTWTNSTLTGSKTKTLKVKAKKGTLNLVFRCVVKAGGKKANSNTVKLFGARITQTDITAKVGDKVKLSLRVYHSSGSVKYQWQVSKDKGKTWKNSTETGNKTKQLTVNCSTAAKLKNYYRCKVTCSKGTVCTNTVSFTGKLAVSIERNKTGVSPGAAVQFISSVACGSGTVTYTWQYSDNNGSTWQTDTAMTGAKPAFTLNENNLTRLYRCVVNDSKGSATSNTIRLIDFTLGEKKPVYRALLIGEEDFYPICERNRGDVNHFANMLGKASAPGGTKYKITKKFDLDYNGVKSAIKSTFADTKDSDVSIFMISTHGNSDGDGELATVGYYSASIPFGDLAEWLNTYVKGKVIVILESCGSGSAVYKKGDPENAANANAEDAAFVEKAVAAFAAADKGVTEAVANMAFNEDGELVVNTGELRTNKFYVLTASRHREMSWGHEYDDEPGNYFIDWLLEGIGSKGSSPADDSPKNSVLTLEELFAYVKTYNDYPFEYDGQIYYQHVQRYPKNSKYPVLMFP